MFALTGLVGKTSAETLINLSSIFFEHEPAVTTRLIVANSFLTLSVLKTLRVMVLDYCKRAYEFINSELMNRKSREIHEIFQIICSFDSHRFNFSWMLNNRIGNALFSRIINFDENFYSTLEYCYRFGKQRLKVLGSARKHWAIKKIGNICLAKIKKKIIHGLLVWNNQ